MKYASVANKRLIAFVLDSIILSILQSIIVSVVPRVLTGDGQSSGGSQPLILVFNITFSVMLLITWLYYAIYEASPKQGTIGKQALGLIVTDINGERISFEKASLRYLARNLNYLLLIFLAIAFVIMIDPIIKITNYSQTTFTDNKVLFDKISGDLGLTTLYYFYLLPFIDSLMAFFTEKKQTLHDILAGTVVLSKW